MSTVPPGTPCWADLATPDLADARRFYPELFGWTGRIPPEPEAGGYTVFLLDGRSVAAAGPPAIPDQVPIWSTYMATDDADLVAGRVERAGGQVGVPPFEVFDRGRMAVFADPAGAAFSVWQPMAMPGAEVFNVPGAMSWNELVTPDPEGANGFPADLPAYWSVYFAVADADAAAARAAELGGTMLVPPQDIPAGRVAALRDPQGALFNVIALPSTGAG